MNGCQRCMQPTPATVEKGDWLYVKDDFFGRGGKAGEVLDVITDEGVGLDFYCGRDGDPRGLPSIEFWEWGELEMCECPEEASHEKD